MSRKVKIKVFIALAVVALGVSEAEAATLNVPSGYATIQAAINAASAGDTINIAAGTYAESLTVNKNLILQGVTPASYSTSSELLVDGILTTIIAPATTTDPAIDVTAAFTSLTVKNIKISGTTGASSFRLSFTGAASNLTIEKVAINGGLRGLSYNSGNLPELTTLVVQDSAFRCSAVTSNGLEIWFVDSGFTITNNYIVNCRDGMNISVGHGNINSPIAGTNIVSNNYIGAVGDSAIQVASPISSLSITGNTFASTGSLEVGTGEGIQVVSNGTATNVSITDNILNGGERAIVLETLANSGSTIAITGNTITNNSTVGVLVAATVSSSNVSGITVNNNTISGNTAGIQNNVSGTTLDAEENYWGASTGPTHSANTGGTGDTSTDNVDYDPWYIDSAKAILSNAPPAESIVFNPVSRARGSARSVSLPRSLPAPVIINAISHNTPPGSVPVSTSLINTPLRPSQTGDDITQLQSFLKFLGPAVYPEGIVSGYYGPLTRQAIIRFQELYRDEILAPLNLTQGTGFVGPATLKKIKELSGQ